MSVQWACMHTFGGPGLVDCSLNRLQCMSNCVCDKSKLFLIPDSYLIGSRRLHKQTLQSAWCSLGKPSMHAANRIPNTERRDSTTSFSSMTFDGGFSHIFNHLQMKTFINCSSLSFGGFSEVPSMKVTRNRICSESRCHPSQSVRTRPPRYRRRVEV